MDNYPPGVTGREDAIMGPLSESESEQEEVCPDEECDFKGTVVVSFRSWSDGMVDTSWDCPKCGRENENEFFNEPDYPDFDDDYDYYDY